MTDGFLMLALICLVFGLAGAIQGATGFGSGLLALAILGMVMDVRLVAILTGLVSLSIIGIILWQLRRSLRWPGVGPILGGVLVGAPVGVFFLAESSQAWLLLGLGVIMLVAGVNGLLPVRFRMKPWHPIWLGIPCGGLGGILTGAFGTGGPPLIAYLSTQGYDRLRFVVTLHLLLISGSLVRLFELIRRDMITGQIWFQAGVASLFAIGGVLLGLKFLRGVPEAGFKLIVSWFLVAIGIYYLVGGFRAL